MRAKHAVPTSAVNPNRAILSIGDEDWPFPVPIRRTNGKWSLDPSQTPKEMRARRIGANELDAIEFSTDTWTPDGVMAFLGKARSNLSS